MALKMLRKGRNGVRKIQNLKSLHTKFQFEFGLGASRPPLKGSSEEQTEHRTMDPKQAL